MPQFNDSSDVDGGMMSIKPGYVVITHYATPNEEGKKVITEDCQFVSCLTDKHLTCATAIIDFQNLEIVKKREEASFDIFTWHIMENYPEKFTEFLKVIGRDINEFKR